MSSAEPVERKARPRHAARAVARYTALVPQERAMVMLLAALCLALFVIGPIEASGLLHDGVRGVSVALVTAAGLLTLARSFRISRWLLLLATAFMLFRVVEISITGARHFPVLSYLFTIASLMLLAGTLLHRVFGPGRVNSARVVGAVAVYLLIALIFAAGYQLVQAFDPGAFSIPRSDGLVVDGQLVYFSLVTLTTTGFGEIVPVHPVARSLVVLEAVIGQIYVAVVLARIVALSLEHRTTR